MIELVEGDDLSRRIARGAVPLDEALPIAKQIAEALEAAHEQGIIHRDLKPANIKVARTALSKVLDFGLAKAIRASGAGCVGEAWSDVPPITSPAMMTGVGMILGTAAYMAPEQARGKTVRQARRHLGVRVVFSRCCTGRRAFGGDDVADTLGAVIHKEPAWTRCQRARRADCARFWCALSRRIRSNGRGISGMCVSAGIRTHGTGGPDVGATLGGSRRLRLR